jgi:hypothetical protein
VAGNSFGFSGREMVVAAFTRGEEPTFKWASFKVDMGQWQHENDHNATIHKKPKHFKMEVNTPMTQPIDWSSSGLGQKQAALLSTWLKELVRFQKTVREVDIGHNPMVGVSVPPAAGTSGHSPARSHTARPLATAPEHGLDQFIAALHGSQVTTPRLTALR